MKAKKIFITFTIALIVIGIGIYFVINSRSSQYDLDNFTKAQLVEVYDYETEKLLYKYETKEDIEKFVDNLNIEKWQISNLDSNENRRYYIRMYQQSSKELIDSNEDTLEEIADIIIFSSGEFVELEVSGIKIILKTNYNLLSSFDNM